jgi:hypothetical protein
LKIFFLDSAYPVKYNDGMDKRKRSPKDVNEIAASVLKTITEQPETGKNPAAVALGRLGGLKGGKARAESLTAKKRKEIAQKAAKTRWAKKNLT